MSGKNTAAPLPLSPLQRPDTFYQTRKDGMIEQVDCLTGRVVAIFNEFGKERDIVNWTTVKDEDGNDIMVPLGITNPDMTQSRSVIYSQSLADIIVQRILEENMSLTQICKEPKMPSYTQLCRWRKDNKDFDDLIRFARKMRAEKSRDEAMEIGASANGASKDDIPGKKLAIETLQWSAEKDDPENYGTKVKVEGQALVALVVETGIRRGAEATPDSPSKVITPEGLDSSINDAKEPDSSINKKESSSDNK